MSGRTMLALCAFTTLAILGVARLRAPELSPLPPRSASGSRHIATCTIQLPEPPPPAELDGPTTASRESAGQGLLATPCGGALEECGLANLLAALASESAGERPRRLAYVRDVLLDHMASHPEAMDEVLARFRTSENANEIGVLMQVLEEHATITDDGLQDRLESEFLETLSQDMSNDRRHAALHFLLIQSESGALSDATIERLRPMAETDPSALIRAGSLWLVAAREEEAARDARLLSAATSDPDATVRETAAEGIGTLGVSPLPREVAERALLLLRGEAQAAVRGRLLTSLLQRGVESPFSIVRGLGELVYAETDADVRRQYVSTLAQIGGAEARPWLEAMREDPAVGEVAEAWLDSLDAPGGCDWHHE